MRRYETVAVLSVAAGEQELKDQIKRLETFLSAKGAKNIAIERAGTKELGYKMKKQAVGHYVYFKFEIESEGEESSVNSKAAAMTLEIQNAFRIDDQILKFETHRIGLPARKFKGRSRPAGAGDSDDLLLEADLGI